MRRVLLTAGAVLAVLLAGTASVRADDGRIGGELSVAGHVATLTSASTDPVRVIVEGDAVTATPDAFDLAPGESVTMQLAGPAEGDLRAHLASLVVSTAGDTVSATLAVRLAPAPRPFDPAPIGVGILILAALALLTWRVRPWELRLRRT